MWLWLVGLRRIDRLALGQHAVEASKLEVERCEREIRRRSFHIESAEKRLATRVYQRAPKKGQPLPERLLRQTEETLANTRAAVARDRARIAELHHLLVEDVPQLVRQYTGCTRAA